MKILAFLKSEKNYYGGTSSFVKSMRFFLKKKKILYKVVSYEKKKILWEYFFDQKKIINLINNYDIVHFNEIWNIENYFIAKILIKIKKPYIISTHGMLDKWSVGQKFYKKILFKKLFLNYIFENCHSVHFLNLFEKVEAKNFIEFKRSFICPNGVDINFFKDTIRTQYKNSYLFLGRIHPKKNLEFLINNWLKVKLINNKSTLSIHGMGEKSYIKKLKSLIKKNKLSNTITIKRPAFGQLKKKIFKLHDIFILPSLQEGDSIAIKEALASGLPVIISKQCKFDEVSKLNAGIVISLIPKSLVNAIRKINNIDILKYKKNARNLAKKYDLSKTSILMLDLFKKAIL